MFRSIVFSLLVILASVQVHAQKVGYINSQDILNAMPEVKQANSDLEVMKNMFDKKAEEMIVAFQAKVREFQQKQASGELAPVEVEKRSKALQEEESKIIEYRSTSEQKLMQKQEELLKPIHDSINKAISDVAAEKELLYIFDAVHGVILYAEPSTEVTQLIKEKLGIK